MCRGSTLSLTRITERTIMTTEYVETRMVMLDELTPFPGNARIGDPARLAESLEANGQYRSLVVREGPDGDLTVLCGNNTLQALEARGDLEARCEIVHCDDATALRVNLVDNKASDDATYDDEARARLIAALDGAVTGSGYTEDEADALLARYEEPEIVQVDEPVTAYNDSDAERAARIQSHGGEQSRTYGSRGVRDIFPAMPAAEADEMGRLIMALRETWGPLDQGTVLLRAARVALKAQETGPGVLLDVAETVYAPEGGGSGDPAPGL